MGCGGRRERQFRDELVHLLSRFSGLDYPIVSSAAVGTGLGNYTIGYVNGNLHINTASLTITATNVSKTYGVLYTPDTTPPSN
jgi:hypothetical protein